MSLTLTLILTLDLAGSLLSSVSLTQILVFTAVEKPVHLLVTMASSGDEMVELGVNEERRLCGLAGDDDEDDMHEDRDALFGHCGDDPITVDDPEDPPPPPPDGNSAKHSRPSTSLV